MVTGDRHAPIRFLRTLFQPTDWVAIFLKSYETGTVAQRVGPLSWVMHPRFQAWLRFKNAQRFNVYVSVNAIAAGRQSRTRDAIGAIRHVFVDADEDGPAVLERIAARGDLPEPSYVLHSSTGRLHVFWRAAEFTPVYVEALQKMLARELGTDPAATAASQMTRVPGFINHKHGRPYLTWVSYAAAAYARTPRDFPRFDAPQGTPQPQRLRAQVRTSLDPVERARRYLERVPPAVEGEHGDDRAFQVCCRLVMGFCAGGRCRTRSDGRVEPRVQSSMARL